MRMLVLIVFLLLVLSLLVQGAHVLRLIRIGRSVAASAKKFERLRSGVSFRVLIVGDSTAVGTGAVDPERSVAGRLGAFLSEAHIENRGVNGLKTAEIVRELPTHVPQKYDLVVVQTGGNDILSFTPLATLRGDIERLLDRAIGVGEKVVLLTAGDIGRAPFFPHAVSWLFTRRTRLVRKIFQATALQKGVQYVDLFVPQVDDVFAGNPRRYYTSDLLHPSADGYGVWFEEVRQTLREAGVLSAR